MSGLTENGSTRRWRNVRALVLDRDGHRCYICGGTADEVDHLTPRTSGGDDDPRNLRAVCRPCNLAKGASVAGLVTVVAGPPTAGKTTYIQATRGTDDVVVDMDALAVALGAPGEHEASGGQRAAALVARRAVVAWAGATASDSAVWIIHTNPGPDAVAQYMAMRAGCVLLDPGREVCMQRAEQRPAFTRAAVDAWYAAPPDLSGWMRPVATVGPSRAWRRQGRA